MVRISKEKLTKHICHNVSAPVKSGAPIQQDYHYLGFYTKCCYCQPSCVLPAIREIQP